MLTNLYERRMKVALAAAGVAVVLLLPASRAEAPTETTPTSILQVLYAPVGLGKGWALPEDSESLARVRSSRAASGPRWRDQLGGEVTAEQIRRFLEERNSPLAPYSGEIIHAANRYGADPRVVVAIAGVESTFGRAHRGHNAWGWNNGRTSWRSWPESIDAFTRLLAERYPEHGNVRRIAHKYNPVTPEAWGRKVSWLVVSISSGQ